MRKARSTSAPKSTPIDPRQEAQRLLTGVRMSPVLDPTIRCSPTTVPRSHYDDGERSDEGSDLEEGDTYMPRYEQDDDANVDSGYVVAEMEEDGTIDNQLGEFAYTELKEELKEPTNMYSGDGPCLRPGIARSFSTALECVRV